MNREELKQLMIGDLVYVKAYRLDDNFQRVEFKKPVRIAEIGNIVTVEDPVNDKEPYLICESTDIEPVRLTPEILEKNGFVCKGAWMIEGEDMGLRQLGDNWGLLPYYADYNGDCFCIISFVHDLQHALRLCGIDKNIEL